MHFLLSDKPAWDLSCITFISLWDFPNWSVDPASTKVGGKCCQQQWARPLSWRFMPFKIPPHQVNPSHPWSYLNKRNIWCDSPCVMGRASAFLRGVCARLIRLLGSSHKEGECGEQELITSPNGFCLEHKGTLRFSSPKHCESIWLIQNKVRKSFLFSTSTNFLWQSTVSISFHAWC